MPRFDYKCRVCGEVFERIAPRDVDILPCPTCPPRLVLAIDPTIPVSPLADRQLSAPANIHIH
jgi:putative FmdB family regulatory protein